MPFDLSIFDTSPAAMEKRRRLKINWLLKIGQTEPEPEDFLQDLFPGSTSIPSEILLQFSWYFARKELDRDPKSTRWFRRLIKVWPPRFPVSETEKADILADVCCFLQGLAVFVKDIKKGVLQAGEQEYSIPGVEVQNLMSLDLNEDGVLHSTFRDIEISALGITTCIKLLDGYPWSALKVCPQCDRLFFSLSQRQKFCSQECNSKSKYKKRIKKADYHESRRLIARKYYLKKEKYMNDTEIAERWRSEGIEEKWIKRLLPDYEGTTKPV